MSEHPEDQRLAIAQASDVTFYSRPGCHLCEAAKAAIEPLLAEFDAPFREVNIDLDPVLTERYGWDIPVIFIGNKKAAKHRVNLKQFRRKLQEAKEKGPPPTIKVRQTGA
jgi:glutaredoxin